MSDEIKDTLDLFYQSKDVVEIMGDFNKLYSTLESKIRHFEKKTYRSRGRRADRS